VLDHVYPVNATDHLALVHDIEYLIYNSQPTVNIDAHAMRQAPFDRSGIAMKLGLSIAQILPFSFNKPIATLSSQETRDIGLKLKAYLDTDPEWLRYQVDNPFHWTPNPYNLKQEDVDKSTKSLLGETIIHDIRGVPKNIAEIVKASQPDPIQLVKEEPGRIITSIRLQPRKFINNKAPAIPHT